MHHPPIPVPMMEPAAIIELLDQHRLAEVIEGSDVRQILGGHFHYTSYSMFAGVPVSVASATCYTTDPAPLDRFISGVDGHQSFTMVHVYDDRIVHTVMPIAEVPEVSGQPSDVREALDALSPEERREMIAARTPTSTATRSCTSRETRSRTCSPGGSRCQLRRCGRSSRRRSPRRSACGCCRW